ncbi:MAG: mechanosensitive ion channel [Bdellovibrionales bacterium]|nr:mechanosensitive ion channel [Bdellovibrionales bacterium]
MRFLDESLFLHLSKVELLKDYLAEKKQELDRLNADLQGDLSHPVNGRRLTNLGTFRAYVNAYVRNIPKIHKDMTILVRQLPATPTGIPLEIYAFSRDTTWAVYEGITADIFDHLFAVITEFGLRVFQNPSGTDVDRALREKRVEGLLSS